MTQGIEELRCDVCGVREAHEKWDGNGDLVAYWYVTVADPIPAGWVVLEDPTQHYRETMCGSCYASSREEFVDE